MVLLLKFTARGNEYFKLDTFLIKTFLHKMLDFTVNHAG